MTLDDAAAILDITEKSVVRLIRERKIRGWQVTPRHGRQRWVINGGDVRARKRALAKKGK